MITDHTPTTLFDKQDFTKKTRTESAIEIQASTIELETGVRLILFRK
jgi:hypothetical protein